LTWFPPAPSARFRLTVLPFCWGGICYPRFCIILSLFPARVRRRSVDGNHVVPSFIIVARWVGCSFFFFPCSVMKSLQHSFCYPWPANVFLAPRSQLPCWLRPLSLSPYSFRHPQLIALLSCREPAFTLITPRVPVPSFAVTPRRCRRSSACACAQLPIAVMDVVSRRRTDSAATLLRLLYSASPSVQPSVSLGCRVSSRCSTT
jgi:hypothetical protein